MRNITTLGKVAEQVESLSRNCTDNMIPVKDIVFRNLDTVLIGNQLHTLRPVAQQSVACRLGIPIQYLRKCPHKIQALNMNHWIREEKNPELFFRFDGPDVRAMFTTRYKPVDNSEIMSKLDSMGYTSDTQVQCHLDPEFMSLSILEGHQSFDINGDKMTPGVSISNSEVGLASVSIAAFVLRLVCTNGMISKTAISESYRHVSEKILEKFSEVMGRVAVDLGRQKEKFRISMNTEVRDPFLTITSFNRQFGLGKREGEAVKWGHEMEPGRTMFSVIQAYTRGAQYKGLSAESSYKLQKTGGMILSMVN